MCEFLRDLETARAAGMPRAGQHNKMATSETVLHARAKTVFDVSVWICLVFVAHKTHTHTQTHTNAHACAHMYA